MTDGSGPNIIGPIGGLLGLGVMAYAAKGLIDVMKDQTKSNKKLKVKTYSSSEDKVWRMLR